MKPTEGAMNEEAGGKERNIKGKGRGRGSEGWREKRDPRFDKKYKKKDQKRKCKMFGMEGRSPARRNMS